MLVFTWLSDMVDTTLAVELIRLAVYCLMRARCITTFPSSDTQSSWSMVMGAKGEEMEDQSDSLVIRLDSSI